MSVRTLLATSLLLWLVPQTRAQDVPNLQLGRAGHDPTSPYSELLEGEFASPNSFRVSVRPKPQHRILTGLGMGLRQIEDWAIYSQLPLEDQSGMVVENLLANLPANQAGIEWHDIIAKVDNKPIGSVEQFIRAYEAVEGNDVPVEIFHQGQRRMVTLDKQAVAKWEKVRRIGVHVHAVPDELALHLRLKPVATEEGHSKAVGLYVSDVREGTPAATSGLQAGDILLKADGRWLTSRELLNNLIRESMGHAMTFEVLRAGKSRQFKIKPKEDVSGSSSPNSGDFEIITNYWQTSRTPAAAAQLQELREAVDRLTKEVSELRAQIKREK